MNPVDDLVGGPEEVRIYQTRHPVRRTNRAARS